MSNHRKILRRTVAAAASAALVVVGLALAPAAAGAADATAGWLRLGHLSPDTKSVDVEVTAARGGKPVLELEGVAYGDVSPYTSLAPGMYRISMVPAGAPASTAPVVTKDVEIDAKTATTVVAYGPSAKLEVKAVSDDLTEPTPGKARIRLFQASTMTDSVDVATTTGLQIAKDARAGSVTGYAEVPAGSWTLDLIGAAASGSTDVHVAAGSVSTLFVLDTAAGGLTILPILDSAAVGTTPGGGVQTGGGGMASAPAGNGGWARRAMAV